MLRRMTLTVLLAVLVAGCVNQMPSRNQQIVDGARPMIFPSLSQP